MGSLRTYGALGGLGKGMAANAEANRKEIVESGRTARDYQLQRMRDRSAMELQKARDKSAMNRTQAENKARKEREVESRKAQSAEALLERAHDINIEQMRQTARENLETRKFTQKNPRFDYGTSKASQTFDPLTGSMVSTPAQSTVTDRLTNVTYSQKGTVFVPVGADGPTEGEIAAGQKTRQWLLSASKEQETDRMLQYLRLFKHLPAEYFGKFGGFQQGGVLNQAMTRSTTQPANQQPAVAQ